MTRLLSCSEGFDSFTSQYIIFMTKFYREFPLLVVGGVREEVHFILGSCDFDKIIENCYASCSFGLAKYIYVQKRNFLNFLAFLSFFGSCVGKFEKRPF